MDYNNKRFKVISNSENGELTDDTVFNYQQQNNVLTCTYKGSSIIHGHLLGLVAEDGTINMHYHQVNTLGEITTGICTSTPKLLADGRIQLHESWQWTSGDKSSGTSVLEEVKSE